jgi:hypothetical protein
LDSVVNRSHSSGHVPTLDSNEYQQRRHERERRRNERRAKR